MNSFERYAPAIHQGIVSALCLRESSEDTARLTKTDLDYGSVK